MAQSNLTISVGIDTGKLRADAAIVKSELREVTKEITRAADEARRTGDTSQLQAQTARQQALVQQYQALSRAITAAGRAHGEAAPAVAALDQRFAAFSTRLREVGTAMSDVADRIFPHFRELAALSLAGAAAAFVKLANDAAKATDELQDSAEAAGVSMEKLLAVQLSAGRVGADPAVATQGLERFARMFGAARLEIQKAQGTLATSVDVLSGQARGLGNSVEIARGSISKLAPDAQAAANTMAALGGNSQATVNIVRGGVKPLLDTSNVFKTLQIDVSKFGATQEDVLHAYIDTANAIDKIKDATLKATIAQQIWGRGWARQIELLQDADKNIKDAEATIRRFDIGPSPAENQRSKEFLAAINTFTTVAGRVRTIIGGILGTALVPLFEGLTEVLGANQAALRNWAQTAANNLMPVMRDLVVLVRDGLAGKFETEAITQAAQVLRFLGAVAREVTVALRGLIEILNLVARSFNAVFGTQFSGTGLLVLGVILRLTGAFGLLLAVFRSLSAGVGVIIGLWRGFAAAGGVAAGLAAAGGWSALLRLLGPAGLVAIGISYLIGKWKELAGAAEAAGTKAADSARKTAATVNIVRGATAGQAAGGGPGGQLIPIGGGGDAADTSIRRSQLTAPGVGTGATAAQPPSLLAEISKTVETTQQELAKISAAWESLRETTASVMGSTRQTLIDMWAFIRDGWNNSAADTEAAAGRVFAAVSGMIQRITAALNAGIAELQKSGSTGGPLFSGQARGGLIRGPGTGTSDSILARLSAGEYVINAASVRAMGTGLLDSLNSFARGGLVAMPPIRFAEGGLVAAASSSGRPVHLHLGSQSFALSGSEHVVNALVGAAHAQQIRSTGVKPSWFAGRPSGR